jgi:hypothetical protein
MVKFTMGKTAKLALIKKDKDKKRTE